MNFASEITIFIGKAVPEKAAAFWRSFFRACRFIGFVCRLQKLFILFCKTDSGPTRECRQAGASKSGCKRGIFRELRAEA